MPDKPGNPPASRADLLDMKAEILALYSQAILKVVKALFWFSGVLALLSLAMLAHIALHLWG